MNKNGTLDNVRVARSRNGQGVFAVREFKIKEVVGKLSGKLIVDDNYESDYCIEIDPRTSLEPNEPFKFINHSCQPNCRLFCWEDNLTEMWLEVIRSIAPGEELCIDYGWPASSAIVCNCGSSECRGWIVACDQLNDVSLYHRGSDC